MFSDSKACSGACKLIFTRADLTGIFNVHRTRQTVRMAEDWASIPLQSVATLKGPEPTTGTQARIRRPHWVERLGRLV